MSRIIPFQISLLTALWVVTSIHQAKAQPVTNLYEIISGEYTVCCGIAGEFTYLLPDEGQSHVQLITDSAQQSAQMVILSFFNGEPIFQTLENGRFNSGWIEFGTPGPAPGPLPGLPWQHYIVSNSASGIRFNGLTVKKIIGADVPNRFAHSNVVANLLTPTPVRPTIRVAAVEICWPSISNLTYQVQYRAALGTNDWTNLQSPVLGNGGTRCVVDQVAPNEPRRFYRVIPVP